MIIKRLHRCRIHKRDYNGGVSDRWSTLHQAHKTTIFIGEGGGGGASCLRRWLLWWVFGFRNFTKKRLIVLELSNFGWIIRIDKNTHPNQSLPVSTVKSIATNWMPIKKLIIAGTVLLLVALMICANTGDGAAEKTADGAATGQPTSLQKDLPTEEKIPTH